MRRHASGNFGHRRQQRQGAIGSGHGLIGDRGDAGRQQIFSLCAVGRQVQIGEQHLAAMQFLALDGERLFDLYDQFGAAENSIGISHDLGAGGAIIGIGQSGARAGVGLHDNLMALVAKFAHRRRYEADAVFVVFYFLEDTDQHWFTVNAVRSTRYIT
jgi:hypothetical protein